ncbi:hypothetical protein TNCV_3265511 [Trichonephila clavipes]|nr:hypothetical protein TNCV_3265511 [Trichonephila clavipes]
MELEGIRVSQNMETNKGNSVLPLMETNKIFPLPPLAVPSTGAILPPVSKAFRPPGLIVSSLRHHHPGWTKTTFSLLRSNKFTRYSSLLYHANDRNFFQGVSVFDREKPYRVV